MGNYKDPYMNFVMNPPRQEAAKYEMYQPAVGTMRIVSNGNGGGLGDIPLMPSMQGDNGNSWVMPVVVIVVSAMALMTLYAILSKR